MAEKIFERREGRASAMPNPPESYEVIGTHRTGGGGHRWYAYAKRGSLSPEELRDFCIGHPSLFGGGLPFFEIQGRNLIVFTLTPGGWIGRGGCWVKAMSRCLKNGGRVFVKKSVSVYIRGREGFLPSDCSHTLREGDLPQKWVQEAEEKMKERKSVFSSSSDHNYQYDIVVFHPSEGEWLAGWMERLKKLAVEKEREEKEKREKNERIRQQYDSILSGFYSDQSGYYALDCSEHSDFTSHIEKARNFAEKYKKEVKDRWVRLPFMSLKGGRLTLSVGFGCDFTEEFRKKSCLGGSR